MPGSPRVHTEADRSMKPLHMRGRFVLSLPWLHSLMLTAGFVCVRSAVLLAYLVTVRHAVRFVRARTVAGFVRVEVAFTCHSC